MTNAHLNIPELEDMVDGDDGPGRPERDGDEHKAVGEKSHVGPTLGENHVADVQLLSLLKLIFSTFCTASLLSVNIIAELLSAV